MSIQAQIHETLNKEIKKLLHICIPTQKSNTHLVGNLLDTGIKFQNTNFKIEVARQKITEWRGIDYKINSGLNSEIDYSSAISTKEKILKQAINNWCKKGLNIVYFDSQNKLQNKNSIILQDISNSENQKNSNLANDSNRKNGKFWIFHPDVQTQQSIHKDTNKSTNNFSNYTRILKLKESKLELDSKSNIFRLSSTKNQNFLITLFNVEKFIRYNAFDVIILDLADYNLEEKHKLGTDYRSNKKLIYKRLYRALQNSKSALIIISDLDNHQNSNASAKQINTSTTKQKANNYLDTTIHSVFSFRTAEAVRSQRNLAKLSGLNNVIEISPRIELCLKQHGKSQSVYLELENSVPNRFSAKTTSQTKYISTV